MEYGIFSYFPTTKDQIKALEKIQLAAIRLALGFRKSTPTNILLAESKLQRWKGRAKLLGERLKQCQTRKSLMFSDLNYFLQSQRKKTKLLYTCLKTSSYSEIMDTRRTFNMYSHDYSINTLSIPDSIELEMNLKKPINPNSNSNNFWKTWRPELYQLWKLKSL